MSAAVRRDRNAVEVDYTYSTQYEYTVHRVLCCMCEEIYISTRFLVLLPP